MKIRFCFNRDIKDSEDNTDITSQPSSFLNITLLKKRYSIDTKKATPSISELLTIS